MTKRKRPGAILSRPTPRRRDKLDEVASPPEIWMLWHPIKETFDPSPDEGCYNCCLCLADAMEAVEEWERQYPGIVPPIPVRVK